MGMVDSIFMELEKGNTLEPEVWNTSNIGTPLVLDIHAGSLLASVKLAYIHL